MKANDFVGKTISEISEGSKYFTIKFTDGSELEVSYSQSGYYGESCELDYCYIPPIETQDPE